MNMQNAQTARLTLEKAVALAPHYSLAKAMLADIYAAISQWNDRTSENLQALSLQLALEAEAINPQCQYAHWAKSFNFYLRKQDTDFLQAANLVLAINPANTHIVGAVGLKLAIYGHYDQGLELMERCCKLNPFLPGWHHAAPSFYNYMRANYEQALANATQIQPFDYIVGAILRAACLGQLGRVKEAVPEIKMILNILPQFMEVGRHTLSKLFYHNHQIEALIQGLSQAGLELK